MKIRLQKYLADAGVASRRAGEQRIREGRVTVNGAVVTELGTRVDPETDRVTYDGAPVKPRRKLYIALNKPRGVLSSRIDPGGRPTVLSLLPKEWSMVYPVGRLDADTEGLLFLTNDGDFCLRLTHPRFGICKRYVALVEGRIEEGLLRTFTRGVTHEGELLRASSARLLDTNNTQSTVELELTEGKNREVRRLFESQGLRVTHLRRLQVGPIKLAELPIGRWRILADSEVRTLMTAQPVARPKAPPPEPMGAVAAVRPARPVGVVRSVRSVRPVRPVRPASRPPSQVRRGRRG